MKIFVKLTISMIVLFPYAGGVLWLASINEASSSEALRGIARLSFFSASLLSLISLFVLTWFPSIKRLGIAGFFAALVITCIFAILGFPKSLGIIGMAFPLVLLSLFYVRQYYRKSYNT